MVAAAILFFVGGFVVVALHPRDDHDNLGLAILRLGLGLTMHLAALGCAYAAGEAG